MTEKTQSAVIAFLENPAAHGGISVKRLDTHAASVFLVGDRALKIKRAIRLPFLDYSTLEKRKAACEAELRVNRAFAPMLYRSVIPIVRTPGGSFVLGDAAAGEVVEWAVDMVRFDETQTLDLLSDAGQLTDALAEELGRMIARVHAIAQSVYDRDFPGSLAGIVAQNAAEMREFPQVFDFVRVTELTRTTQKLLERMGPLLRQREKNGWVRRCHGDLHLANIVLFKGTPVLFDAIEFDEQIATVDLFYDLAFLLMDMIERRQRKPANIVFNRYLAERNCASDLDALVALPLFMSLRACIRAKVTAERLAQTEGTDEIRRKAQSYFALASRVLQRSSPRLVAIGGLSGSGKSTLARGLAPEIRPDPGAVLLRSDVERKRLFGVSESTRLPESAYAADVTDRVYAMLAAKAKQALAAGHSVIVDGTFSREEQRRAIEAAGGTHRFTGLYLEADLPTRIARIQNRGKDASDADVRVALAQEGSLEGRLSWHTINAAGSLSSVLEQASSAVGCSRFHSWARVEEQDDAD